MRDPRTQNMPAWWVAWWLWLDRRETVELRLLTVECWGPTKENISTRFFISPVPSQSELLHADQAGACIVNAGLWSNFLCWLLLCHRPQLVSIFSVQLKWTRSWCGKKMIYVQVSPLTRQHQHSVTGGFNYSAAMIAACLRSRQFHTICVLTSSSETIHEIVTKAV